MKFLECSREEAEQIIADDDAVDKMDMSEVDSDLTADQKKAKKKMSSTGVKSVDAYGRKRVVERKPNENKRYLIEILKNLLENEENCSQIDVTNIERQIDFTFNGKKTRIVLSEPRKQAEIPPFSSKSR